MTLGDALAYFPDDRDLTHLVPNWPLGMTAVLCLDDAGRCEVMVCHRDEGASVLRRVADVLGKPRGGFAVFPQVEGHPTRRILFSEEQQLLSLLTSAEKLQERASDYAINYAFAREEGLDPECVISPRTGGRSVLRKAGLEVAATDGGAGGGDAQAVAQFRTRRDPVAGKSAQPVSASKVSASATSDAPSDAPSRADETPSDAVLTARIAAAFFDAPAPGPTASAPQPTRITALPDATRDLPAGYAPLGPARRGDCQVLSARIERRRDAVRLILRPDEAGATTLSYPAQVMGFRDDFARFVLPRRCLGIWSPDEAAILDIAVGQFPQVLAERFASGPVTATVTVTPQGIFVLPDRQIPAPAAHKRRGRVPVSAALALGLAGLVAGVGMGGWLDAATLSRALPGAVASLISPANAAVGEAGSEDAAATSTPRADSAAMVVTRPDTGTAPDKVAQSDPATQDEQMALGLMLSLARGERAEPSTKPAYKPASGAPAFDTAR